MGNRKQGVTEGCGQYVVVFTIVTDVGKRVRKIGCKEKEIRGQNSADIPKTMLRHTIMKATTKIRGHLRGCNIILMRID